jgi:tungstate transport system substrate-binding protein
MGAYVLSDRGTYVAWHHYDSLALAVEGEPALINQYGIIVVNPAKHRHVKRDLGQIFTDWMIGHDGQSPIASYRIGGQQLFFPNAKNRN